MLSLLWLGCGPAEPVVVPAPAEAAPPTADQILARHAAVTRQCELLERDSFLFRWQATTEDGHTKQRAETILYQGQPGRSFTRVHQHTLPVPRFIAFGRTAEGKTWSAGEGAIQTELPPEVAASMQSQLDPTPLCNWGARWPVRTLMGAETYQEFPAWRVELVWADGTPTEMWFHRESGLLMGSRSKAGDVVSTTTLTDYQAIPCEACSGPVSWPRRETGTRTQGPLTITTEQTLGAVAVDIPAFKPIGPADVAKVLVEASAELAGDAPKPAGASTP